MHDPSSPGHQEWVHALVERYERPLTLYAMRFLHDPEKSRDAVQEVFLRLCRQRKEDLATPESAWLYTVCRNVALDQLRKDKRMKPLSQEAIDTTASAAIGPGQMSESHELQSLILQRLGNLPEHQQECIRLKFQHGHSYREIAQITQMSVSNVGYLIHTGLQSLRKQLV